MRLSLPLIVLALMACPERRADRDGDAPPPPPLECDAGQHACDDACVSDDAAETCGTRCSPCPAPSDGKGTPVCVVSQ